MHWLPIVFSCWPLFCFFYFCSLWMSISTLPDSTSCVLFQLSSLYIYTLSPPSVFPHCWLANSFPTLPPFSPASCKITTLPSLRLSVHAQESVCALCSGGCLCEWPCESEYFDKTRDSKKRGERERTRGEKTRRWGTECSHVEDVLGLEL